MIKRTWVAALLGIFALTMAAPKASQATDDIILRLTTRYEYNKENDDTWYNMMVLTKIYPHNYLLSGYLVSAYNAEGTHMKSNTVGLSGMKTWPGKGHVSIGYSYTYSFGRGAGIGADDDRFSFAGQLTLWTGARNQQLALTGSYNTLTSFDRGQLYYAGLQFRYPINEKWSSAARARYAYSEDLNSHIFNEFMARVSYKLTDMTQVRLEYRFFDNQRIGNVSRKDNHTLALGLNFTY